jgi:hypothetical protein
MVVCLDELDLTLFICVHLSESGGFIAAVVQSTILFSLWEPFALARADACKVFTSVVSTLIYGR